MAPYELRGCSSSLFARLSGWPLPCRRTDFGPQHLTHPQRRLTGRQCTCMSSRSWLEPVAISIGNRACAPAVFSPVVPPEAEPSLPSPHPHLVALGNDLAASLKAPARHPAPTSSSFSNDLPRDHSRQDQSADSGFVRLLPAAGAADDSEAYVPPAFPPSLPADAGFRPHTVSSLILGYMFALEGRCAILQTRLHSANFSGMRFLYRRCARFGR
jgi:hypothetical protein